LVWKEAEEVEELLLVVMRGCLLNWKNLRRIPLHHQKAGHASKGNLPCSRLFI
jgi:hypothetical protein